MCKTASFIMNPKTKDIKVWDLCGHSETYEHYGLSDDEKPNGYRECHYTPAGEIECRMLDIDSITSEEAAEYIKEKYPSFKEFFNSFSSMSGGSLDLSGCDLKWIKLPETIGGYLNLSGCDLKGIKLPETIGGFLNLSGCDLKGIKLPETIGGSLYLRECDLKGIKLPETIGGFLNLSGCDLKGIKLPDRFKDKIIK